ncbi:D-glycerate dehydrogenase [Psychrobacillus sp. NEAU-3TGS]|uniref:2-hydroxyacid dehydrogenase n=1 Tax=Psychrobacillus sp. NEAU-3TGS TaxID=2995412 RepID=UPI0024996713|nr:D-glycerate dehydrogenase [Psychrobacillus sp. NEAU-3TGS]MDI2586788.1 D-glycerate dehydrogenase [Psychrobacillus sp. NEAU-3TGS]
MEKPVLEELKSKYDVKFFKNINTKTDKVFLDYLEKTEGIIGLDLVVDKDLLENAPNLKIVSNVSVGYNNLDVEELTNRNIMATNTPDVLTDTVADTVFGLLLATARRIPELDHFVKSKRWNNPLESEHYGIDVHHKTLGIIGMGKIGQAIAQRASLGFDMKILYNSRKKKPEAEAKYNATYCSLDELLKQSDFVILITPLTEETNGFIGRREFQLMKKSAIFINGSRGKTIIEKDLIESLKNGEIAAAGLDVFKIEPVEHDNPLLNMKNVVTLPHIGSSTYETELKMSELAAKNLVAGLNGEKPPSLINTDVWENIKPVVSKKVN